MERETEIPKHATDCSEDHSVAAGRRKNTNLQVASVLLSMLSELMQGKRDADSGMEEVLHFAAERLGFSKQGSASSSKSGEGTDEARDGEECRGAVRERHQLGSCGDYSCSQFASPMDPSRWGTLPKELIRAIFAHLPLATLLSLRRFTLKLDCTINLDDMDFRRLCAQFQTKALAVILPSRPRHRVHINGSYSVGMQDMTSTTWQKINLSIGDRVGVYPTNFIYYPPMISSDGGLVCFAQPTWEFPLESRISVDSLVILVVNPLTGECKKLPQPSMVLLKMMKLVMDQERKGYKLTLVGLNCVKLQGVRPPTLVTEQYDSLTGEWTTLEKSSDVIFGLQYHWWAIRGRFGQGRIFHGELNSFNSYGVYHCATGRLLQYSTGPRRSNGKPLVPFVLLEDRVYVLHHAEEDPGTYVIYEHQVPVDGWMGVHIKEHRFDRPYAAQNQRPDKVYDVWFLGCKGFLLVVEEIHLTNSPHSHKVAWLYNLSTGVWTDFPELRDGRQTISDSTVLCELKWDAVP